MYSSSIIIIYPFKVWEKMLTPTADSTLLVLLSQYADLSCIQCYSNSGRIRRERDDLHFAQFKRLVTFRES